MVHVRIEEPLYTEKGVPFYLSADVYYTANEQKSEGIELANVLASLLKEEIIRIVSNFNGWSRTRTLARTSGVLKAISTSTGKGCPDTNVNLNSLDGDLLLDMYERIVNSNDVIEMDDLSWAFWINPNSITEGGAATDFPLPKWVARQILFSTWKSHYFVSATGSVKLNCAAYALYCGVKKLKKGAHCTSYATLAECWNLQNRLNWGEYVTFDELENFVLEYPDYKICVIKPPFLKGDIYVGDQYVYDDAKKILYLYYHNDPKNDVRHFALVDVVGPILPKSKNWCNYCCISFRICKGHDCDERNFIAKKKTPLERYECPLCLQYIIKYNEKNHYCFGKSCTFCQTKYDTSGDGWVTHRCPLKYESKVKDKKYAFLVYDLESRFEEFEEKMQLISEFNTDSDGFYEIYDQDSVVYSSRGCKHVANLVCVKDINTSQTFEFFGENCLQEFLDFCFSYNNGLCVLLAHNSSGYDSRLLFDVATKYVIGKNLNVLMRGSKLLQMKIADLRFIDIMLHIPGSVKSLARDFGCVGRKGDFPFLFNKLENYNYSGTIPGLEYFSLQNCKTEQDYQTLLKWHSEFEGEWNFMEQLKIYCRNDVSVSCEMAKAYNDVWVEKGLVPWLFPTGAGVVNRFMGLKAWEMFSEKYNRPNVSHWSTAENYEWLDSTNFRNEWWTVCTNYEHFYAKAALRGGRTEVRRMHYKLSDADRAAGKKILYVDVCSMYPYQQIAHEFPVGVPTIYFFTSDYYAGCQIHYDKVKCRCPFDLKKKSPHVYSFKKFHEMKPIEEWFGFVCVTLIPPKNLLHPLIVYFDDEKLKCISSLRDEDHVEIVIGTNTFKKCLQVGYRLVEVHSYHEYNRGNYWRKPCLDLYLDKMMYSKNAPERIEDREAFIEKWQKVYGEEFGEKIRNSWPNWGKLPAKKLVAKLAINSVWGKHAQRVDLPRMEILDVDEDEDALRELWFNIEANKISTLKIEPLSDKKAAYGTKTKEASLNYHNQYIPTASFVPEYGRLQLWEEMNKLGDRVLYCDTDSIIYVYDPELYNVPTGDMIGDWEVEDVCNREIIEFVSWGPKTYGIRCASGDDLIKAKGVSLKRATSKIMNFDIMRDAVLAFLNDDCDIRKTMIPSTNFVWGFNTGMVTRKNYKQIMINKNELKGVLKDGYIYPFGYEFE
jgi:hypothetical protein